MGGTPIDFETHCKFNFGAYVQAEYITDPTNTMEERTKDAIYLDTLDGPQGGYECLNLRTGRIITAYKLYELPLTDLAKARVEELAAKDKIPEKLTFEPGTALIHHGSVPHESMPITEGERSNFVLWLYGNQGRVPPHGAEPEQVSPHDRWTSVSVESDGFAPF